MSLTDSERREAYQAFAETYGPKTDIVIAMLRPAIDLATRDDLAALEARMATKDDLAALEARMEARMASKDDLVALEARMESRMASKDDLAVAVSGMRAEMAELRSDLRSELHAVTTTQTRMLVFALLTAIIVSGAMNSMTVLLQS